MKLIQHRLKLPITHQFTIARGSLTEQCSLIVELSHDGHSGFGEVTENTFYGHTFDSMSRSLEKAESLIDEFVTLSPIKIWPKLLSAMDGDVFALSALDMAAHDLRGKLKNVPTWQDWELEWNSVPESSYTIGIDDIDRMVEKLREKPDWSIYKIKLGTQNDIEIVTELRQHTNAVFRVDANCGWSVEKTISNSHALAELGVEFIEQPLPDTAADDDKRRVFEASSLPVIADEDCQTESDVDRCEGLFHGVNVKICKCGGLTPALRMLKNARERGMKTMLGCMVESSIGISGAAQLLPLLDYADLDGAVLLNDEPANGVSVTNGEIVLAKLPGTGASLDRQRLASFVTD